MSASIRVTVTAADIRNGVAGNCFACPVAVALQRATGDDHAKIFERAWELRIEARCRVIGTPWEVVEFVREFDGLERTKSGRIKRGVVLPKPFKFELPPFTDDEWEEECHGCEQLFPTAELDDEGYCEDCRSA